MEASEFVMVFAVLTAPLFAIQASQWLERRRESRNRRLRVFEALMATRGADGIISPRHIEALNAIDIAFHGTPFLGSMVYQNPRHRSVIDAWNLYRSHLNKPSSRNDGSFDEAWGRRTNELLVDLLYEMSKSLGYHFDKAFIERGIYSPKAHENLERDQRTIHEFCVKLANGQTAIPVAVLTASNFEEVRRRNSTRNDISTTHAATDGAE